MTLLASFEKKENLRAFMFLKRKKLSKLHFPSFGKEWKFQRVHFPSFGKERQFKAVMCLVLKKKKILQISFC